MHANTVAVDLAKSVFQVAVADSQWRVIERHRLTRTQFERFFVSVGLVVMEACGSAHYWAWRIAVLGIEVRLLPARYIRAYVKRNKTRMRRRSWKQRVVRTSCRSRLNRLSNKLCRRYTALGRYG